MTTKTKELITYLNRKSGKEETEKVYGDALVRFLYDSNWGKKLNSCLSSWFFSYLVGLYQDSKFSKRKISSFIKNYQINMDEFLPSEGKGHLDPYANFNEFFIRRFRDGVRTFPKEVSQMGAPAEARYFAFNKVEMNQLLPVKGKFLSMREMFQRNVELEKIFEGGPLMIARLCPVDYHRFHFPDAGEIMNYIQCAGPLHSVNPIALGFKDDILCTNQRELTIIQTENFGKLAYIEVGALCVGKIIQTYDIAKPVKRGEEKGYFLFGGSTVIIIGEAGKWKPAADILANTGKGMETYIQLGDVIGDRLA